MNRHSDQAPPNPRPPPFPEEPGLPPLHTGKQPVPSALRSDSVHQEPASRARLGQHQRNRMCSLQFIRFSQFDVSASLIITHIFRISTMNSFVKLKATTKPRFPRTFSQSENASEIQAPRKIPSSACRMAAYIEHLLTHDGFKNVPQPRKP